MISELDHLISEQERDARSFRVHSVSVDAWPSGADLPKQRLTANDDRHGTLTMSKVYGCKCEKCRAASAAYQREYNRRRGTKTAFVCTCCGSRDVKKVTL